MAAVSVVQELTKRCFQFSYQGASRVGERLGWDWLTYNPGVYLSFRRAAIRNAPKFANAVLATFPDVRSVCDIGCGPGVYVAEFQARGLHVHGCEYSPRARRWAERLNVTVSPFDLSQTTDPLPGIPYDLAISLEVAEHLPAEYAEAFVAFMVQSSDQIVLTAAHPGQGGIGHVNEQPQSYWIEKVVSCGFAYERGLSESLARRLQKMRCSEYLSKNMMVFRRESARASKSDRIHPG